MLVETGPRRPLTHAVRKRKRAWFIMDDMSELTWSLPLSARPRIDAVGIGPMAAGEAKYLPAPQWQIGLFEGETTVALTHGKRTWSGAIGARTMFVIPPRSTRRYSTPRATWHYYAQFTFPKSTASASASTDLAALLPLRDEAGEIERQFGTAIDLRASDRRESDLLIELILVRLGRITRERRHGRAGAARTVAIAAQRARRLLADGDLTPGRLARGVGLSRRRLDQLFTDILGVPVAAWIRGERLARARQLLMTTSIPVSRIGEVTGLGDAQQFNKFIRRTCGMSPSEVRGRADRRHGAVHKSKAKRPGR